MDASALESAISALESAIRTLDTSSEGLESFWLPFWTALVVIGVVIEIAVVSIEHRDARRASRGATIRSPEQTSLRKFLFDLTGPALVVIGVAGEFSVGISIAQINGKLRTRNAELRSKTGELIGLLNKEAGDAKTSAEQAAAAASGANVASEKAKEAASDAATLARGARREADSVQQEIGKASDRLAQLRTDARNLEAENLKTKSELINLAVCNAPRVIISWSAGGKSTADPLRSMAGQVVYIEVVPDAEARRAALNIAAALMDAKWDVQTPLRLVDGITDGVSVQPSAPPLLPNANLGMYWHTTEVTDALLDFLHSYNWQATRGWPIDARGKLIRDEKALPSGAIRIQIGLYPAAIYVSPPGQKELDSRLEETRRVREQFMAEAKRKREAQLNGMLPEARKRLAQLDEEWEAKTKGHTSAGPCQVLNPLY